MSAPITVMMRAFWTILVMGVLMMDVRNGPMRGSYRAGQWRRYDAGELGDQEQGDQHADKTSYRPQALHQCLSLARFRRRSTPHFAALEVGRQSQ
jgi:hypothetical protein